MLNNNMFGNQQSMRPNFMSELQRKMLFPKQNVQSPVSMDMPNGVMAFAGEPREVMRSLAPYRSPTSEMTSFRDTKERARAYSQSYGNGRAYDKFHLQDYPAEFAKEQGWDPPAPSPLPPHPTNEMMARHGFSHPAPVDYASKNSIGAVGSGLSLIRKPNLFDAMQQANTQKKLQASLPNPSVQSPASMSMPNLFDAMQQANIRRKMQIPPPTGNPTQSNLPNPSVQSPVAMGMAGLQRPSFMTSGANSQSLYTQRPIGQGVMQQRMANNMSAASRGAGSVPQYINPTGRAIQSQLAQSNQSLAGSLNSRLDRRFDLNPGATAESNVQRQLAGGMIPTPNGFQPRQDTGEARNVLAGQPMGLDRTMRALNIPGMHLEGNRMVKDAPVPIGGANMPNRGLGGMTPNQFRNYQSFARNAESGGYTAPIGAASDDGYTSKNDGYQILNSQARAMKRNPDNVNTGLNSSYANTRMARMARRNGFGSAASFQNFMNQYNARQNRGTTPLGVATTAGAFATQGLLQGRNGGVGQGSNTASVEGNNQQIQPETVGLEDAPSQFWQNIPAASGFPSIYNWLNGNPQKNRR